MSSRSTAPESPRSSPRTGQRSRRCSSSGCGGSILRRSSASDLKVSQLPRHAALRQGPHALQHRPREPCEPCRETPDRRRRLYGCHRARPRRNRRGRRPERDSGHGGAARADVAARSFADPLLPISKYLNSPDTPLFDKGRTLYNIDRASPASRAAKRLIVVEGYMDVIALDRAGIAEVVAPNGTAVTEVQLERMWRLDPSPILCFRSQSISTPPTRRSSTRAARSTTSTARALRAVPRNA